MVFGCRRDAAAAVHWPPPVQIPEELEESEGVPDVFKCPITLGIMREPAQTPQGDRSGVSVVHHCFSFLQALLLSMHYIDCIKAVLGCAQA